MSDLQSETVTVEEIETIGFEAFVRADAGREDYFRVMEDVGKVPGVVLVNATFARGIRTVPKEKQLEGPH